MKIFKSIQYTYSKLSNFGKILIFVILFLLVVVFFKNVMALKKKEGFTQNDKFLFRENSEIYDDFYATIYDHLVYNAIKNEYECGTIVKATSPSGKSVIADIGCGTGHHVARLSDNKLNVIGVDSSKSMIKKAKENHPNCNFKVGDALDSSTFNYNSLTHVLCLYFTIYYFKDKRQFFDNCIEWLMPGGHLIVHLVDREKFDPILPPGNPLYVISPQKYAKERITTTKITFNDFVYNSKFSLDKANDIASFDEKFKFNDGNVRSHQQKLYMEDTSAIVNSAQECGFILEGKIDLVKCAYENQYLYIFMRPS
jgi:SAM-dependent methyltransferase